MASEVGRSYNCGVMADKMNWSKIIVVLNCKLKVLLSKALNKHTMLHPLTDSLSTIYKHNSSVGNSFGCSNKLYFEHK